MSATRDERRFTLVDGQAYERLADGTLAPRRDETDHRRLAAMSDADVTAAAEADPDARPFTDEEWLKADLVTTRATKVAVALRLDPQVLAWFKSGGPGYQTRINAVLKRYVEAREKVS